MKYKVGVFGGSFDPLHIGHIHDIIRGASECEEFYVMISHCEGRESISKEVRYRWIYNSSKHLSNVKIIMVEDKAISKADYNTDYFWEKGAQDIKNAIGKKIDVVYCGSDYLGTNRFESLYAPESEIVYFDRKEVPIASSDIREWAFTHWDYIPQICRSFYTKKIAIVGSESAGKSTLVRNLAMAYNTNYVDEVGRTVCDKVGSEDMMTHADLEEILLRHKLAEIDALEKSNRLLFIDTDCLTTKFYSNFLLTKDKERAGCNQLAEAISNLTSFDLIFFIEPVNAFVQDGTRNTVIQTNRVKYSNELKVIYQQIKQELYILDGTYVDNFNKAKEVIKKELKIDTIW